MENLGLYLSKFKEWIKEGWKFLFEDTDKIKAHHLLVFLLTIIIVYLLSYIISKIFKTVIKLCIMIAVIWLLWMLIFDRGKWNELFSKPQENNGNR